MVHIFATFRIRVRGNLTHQDNYRRVFLLDTTNVTEENKHVPYSEK